MASPAGGAPERSGRWSDIVKEESSDWSRTAPLPPSGRLSSWFPPSWLPLGAHLACSTVRFAGCRPDGKGSRPGLGVPSGARGFVWQTAGRMKKRHRSRTWCRRLAGRYRFGLSPDCVAGAGAGICTKAVVCFRRKGPWAHSETVTASDSFIGGTTYCRPPKSSKKVPAGNVHA
jgi:hypothetical protein